MQFETGHIYHIYNQGNNKQKIFFCDENYLFFLRKLRTHIIPYVDVLAWCLMPNHFHVMVYVKYETLWVDTHGVTQSSQLHEPPQSGRDLESEEIHPMTNAPESLKSGRESDLCNDSHRMNTRTLNDSIAIMLRSYTRAINKQENSSGSLFRAKTKAQCLTTKNGITPAYFNTAFGTIINIEDPEKSYPQVCFNYIHNNPVAAGLAESPEQWAFSSARDFYGSRNGKLINKERVKYFELV